MERSKSVEWFETDPLLERWVGTKAKATRRSYRKSWSMYKEFTEKLVGREVTTQFLVEEFEKDRITPISKGGGKVPERLVKWHRYMVKECPNEVTKKLGLSYGTAKSRIGSIMAFYRKNTGHKIEFTERFSDLFPALSVKENRKMLLEIDDVKALFYNARSLRERAFILTMFETGSDVDTVIRLNVGDVNLEDDWATLHLIREKVNWEYVAHLGPNGIRALKAYLQERKSRKHNLDKDQPLFVVKGVGGLQRLNLQNVDKFFVELGYRIGLVKRKDVRVGRYSPVRPYCLRGSFSTHLETAKCPPRYVEYWQGHKIKFRGAYFTPNEKLSLQTYMEHYDAISIETGAGEIKELEKRMRDTISDLVLKNKALEGEVKRLKPTVKDIEAEANADNIGLGGGMSLKRPLRYDDLSDEEKAKYFQRALMRKMLGL